MKTTNLLLIDGQPMLVPDAGLPLSVEDMEAADSGRDESGVLHRFVVRQGMKSWDFSYARLTGEEYAYMEGLFAWKSTFCFTYPSAADGTPQQIEAYRGKHGILWDSAADGQFRNYQFRIAAC